MERAVELVGYAMGLVGIVAAAVAGIARLSGRYHLAGMGADSVLAGGTALLAAGCFALLFVLLRRARA